MERLLDGTAWVVFNFNDGSKRTLHTTLSEKVLSVRGIPLREDFLYDIDRRMYVKMRSDAVSVDIFDNRPVFEEEVLNFASRFV